MLPLESILRFSFVNQRSADVSKTVGIDSYGFPSIPPQTKEGLSLPAGQVAKSLDLAAVLPHSQMTDVQLLIHWPN